MTPLAPRRVATLDFIFPDQPRFTGWSMQDSSGLYLADHWIGEPVESEEVAPRWFRRDAIPYPGMWSDALYWLPPVLRGQRIRAEFHFDEEQRVKQCSIIEEGNRGTKAGRCRLKPWSCSPILLCNHGGNHGRAEPGTPSQSSSRMAWRTWSITCR